MFGNSFKSRVILPVILVLATLTIVLTVLVSVKFLSFNNSLIDEKLLANAQSLRFFLEDSKDRTRAAAVSMASNPETINALGSRCPEALRQILESAIDLYRVDYFTVTDDTGIVLFRTHEPDNHGDSLRHIHCVSAALDGRVSSQFDACVVVKVSARTGAPVYDTDGTFLGAISAGIRFDIDEAVDRLKTYFDSDVTVVFGDTRIATTNVRNGHRINNTVIENQNIIKILTEDKQEYFGNTDVAGIVYRIFGLPLFNAQAEPFAAILIGAPLSELHAESNALVRNIVLISGMGLLVAALILYRVISSISEPLAMLSEGMSSIENGDLNVTISHNESGCELGRARKAMWKMANTIQRLITEISVTISEHEKGNTDYRLDSSAFYGDYRTLVEQIMKLSDLGMNDQLTKLPNRRSFDNRLALEWNRANREKVPLSILMLDVDHFKAYNDTYGHQQGDVALRIVAGIIPKPLRRATDFAARWGGEEFVVLLPNTDLKGAMRIAEEIRAKIESTAIPSIDEGSTKKVTVSIGINTQIPLPNTTIEALIAKADEALYRAKKAGRNKVCWHESETALDGLLENR